MNKNKMYSKWFAAPALTLYTVLFIVPVLAGIVISMTDWTTSWSSIHFVGLKNYVDIFSSSGGPYLASVGHTLLFTVITVVAKTLLGLGLALVLNKAFCGRNVFRALYFLPYTLAPLIIGIAFVSILKPTGPLNQFLTACGLENLTYAWLSNPKTALASTMAVEVWRMAGWNMMILLAGLQTIPTEYYEASAMDGAGAWSQFTHITLPFLRPSFTTVIVLNTIHGLKVFDIIYALTGGGPGNLTEVINTQVFREFSKGRYGMSNALSVVAFLATLVLALIMRKALAGKEETQ